MKLLRLLTWPCVLLVHRDFGNAAADWAEIDSLSSPCLKEKRRGWGGGINTWIKHISEFLIASLINLWEIVKGQLKFWQAALFETQTLTDELKGKD